MGIMTDQIGFAKANQHLIRNTPADDGRGLPFDWDREAGAESPSASVLFARCCALPIVLRER